MGVGVDMRQIGKAKAHSSVCMSVYVFVCVSVIFLGKCNVCVCVYGWMDEKEGLFS